MAATPMSPGTVLDGRYRLEVLLSEHEGARFWRATDTVLERSVAVHVVPSEDPRSGPVLEAARTSAAVTDPHFLRVLDCADVDGVTWVINEWGEGVSLDVMLNRGTLPSMRAAWLVREVAEAIASAHAQGLCHGRLNPEAVLVTESGSVKLIGFVVNAAFERNPGATTSVYGAISPREVDVVDLAGVLYAALTGKWPGVSPSAVPPAPREGKRLLRPRQVRAGVPRTLDTICDRVLNKEASQHAMPIETALEIAAALSDFVGDPTLVAPVDVSSVHDEPEPVPLTLPGTVLGDDLLEQVEAPVEPEAEVPVELVETPREADDEDVPADEEESVSTGSTSPVDDPESTMATPPPFSPSGIEYFEPEDWAPMTPLPPFEQPPERPLFADSERRVPTPPAAPVEAAAEAPGPSVPGVSTGSTRSRRSKLRAFLVTAVAIAVAVAMYLAFQAGKDDEPTGADTPAPTTTPTATAQPSATPVVSGTVLRVQDIGSFDPEGNPPTENANRARLAIDGKPATAWPTDLYPDARLGSDTNAAKAVSGVGLVLDLGSEKAVTGIEVQLVGAPTGVSFYATPSGVEDAPAELSDATSIGRVASAQGTATVQVAMTRTRYLIIWLTELPADGTGFRGQIAEITVRS